MILNILKYNVYNIEFNLNFSKSFIIIRRMKNLNLLLKSSCKKISLKHVN